MVNIIKNMRTIPLVLLAGAFQIPSLNLSVDSIKLNSSKEYTYSLLETQSLLNPDWQEVSSVRGNDSNLLFNITKDAPQKFFKAIAHYDPVSPTNLPHFFRRQDKVLGTISFDEQVTNYSTNLNVNVTWTETFNPTYASYGINMPFTQTLTNGVNIIHTIFSDIGLGTGQNMAGNINIEVAQ